MQMLRVRRGVGALEASSLRLLLLVVAECVSGASPLRATRLAFTWGTVSFVFDSESQRTQMLRNGSYVPGNSVPFGVDADPNSNRVFLSLPALFLGSPVTLSTVENVKQTDSPRLVPYPDWSWHAGARGCDGLTSVFRSEIDECGRLWAIDSGVVDIADTSEQRCPPQLVVFNLTTNQMVRRHRFAVPENCREALLLNVLVDQRGDACSDDVFAYVADPLGFAIYVYSFEKDRSWRVQSDLFFPDVNARAVRVDGTTWNGMDGVLALAHDGTFLYFHSLISFQEGRVPLSVLRNEQLFADGLNGAADQFQFLGHRRYQSGGDVMSSRKILFFHQISSNAIYCWDTRRTYVKFNHIPVEEDRNRLHFVSDMRIVRRGGVEELWAIDNNAQRLFTGQFKPNATNNINVIWSKISNNFGSYCHLNILHYP